MAGDVLARDLYWPLIQGADFMGKSHDKNNKVAQRISQDAESPLARCAHWFEAAGFSVRVAALRPDASGRHRPVDLLAERRISSSLGPVEASWHVAPIRGHDGILSALKWVPDKESGDEVREDGFRPLANPRFDGFLAALEGRSTGVSLLDAPKVEVEALGGVFGKKASGCKDYRALARTLDSCLDWIGNGKGDHQFRLRFALPLLITDASMFEAVMGDAKRQPAETCFLALRHEHDGPRCIDVVSTEFLETYVGMAAEVVEQLPGLLADIRDHREPGKPDRPKTMMDAWDAFRAL